MLKHGYSGIITKGLGLPACCAMITANFGLVCGCKIQVINPPIDISGGGGGSYAVAPGIYVPWPKSVQKNTKMVLITVKFNQDKTWRQSYIISTRKADIVVRVIGIVNAMTAKLQVGVRQLKHAARKVTAAFTNRNK
jgi:hypothetical protein